MDRPPDSPRPPARYDNRYSRFVAWVKLALPLAALALLSTLFLVPGPSGREGAPALDADDLRDMVQKRLLRSPTYTSVTEDGGALTVTADTATPRPGDADLFDATDLAVEHVGPGGGRATLAAEAGEIDRRAQEATFLGTVRVATEEGYVLRTERLEAKLDGSRAVSPLPVRIEGPAISIEAGSMRATTAEGGVPGGRILFKEGVRLVYSAVDAAATASPE